MSKNYRQLSEAVRSRLNPENVVLNKAFSDELSTISYSDVLTYVRLSMKGVEPQYTQRSRDAGEKVKEHLSKNLTNVAFRYQGSVMTDTHIKGYSDIDLLTICNKFYTWDSSGVTEILNNSERKLQFHTSSINKMEKEVGVSSYAGNSLQDLKDLRANCEQILGSVYSVCDKTKSKSIKIKNLSLNREVDVVIANWYDDVRSIINDKGDNRGIQVYNKDSHSVGSPDYPFVSINRINEKSSNTNGRLKKMIRFLKNLKAVSDQDIDLSSFDINAICYDIEASRYGSLSFIELVPVLYTQLKNISTDQTKADSIISVDGREYIFRYNPRKLENVKKILGEVEGIYLDLKKAVHLV
jgi:hypothetical protein